MKSILTTILLLAASTGSIFASAIQFATGGGRGHMFITSNPDGARVPALSLVRVGYVTTPGDVSTFVEFATTTMSNPSAAILIGGFLTTPANSLTVAAAAKGAQVYLWVYNSPAAGTATQAGIFTSTDASWVIPASFTGDPTETSNLTLNLVSGVTAIPDPNLGGVPTFTRGDILINGTAAVGSIFRLAPPVPEPSTALFGFIAVGALALRRRRA